ncbi:MAG: aspartyl/glutamyl-tRNA amidotransferase subunit C [Bacilli bacterium]|nr:aspartyl/glutamyl-tRNA amidotransferase subunit C [Bacilli bacterium]
MKTVDLKKLQTAANRLCFDMSEEEYQTLLNEFRTITKQMELIAEDKTIDQYEPMIYPFPCVINDLRDDEPINPSNRDEILKNAQNKLAGQIKVKKVNG